MAIADVGLGAQLGLKQLLMQRMQAQQYADQMRQQQFENQRQLAGDSRADQQLAETSSLRRAMEADAATQKGSAEANALGEQIPPNAFLPETDPAVATMQKYGRGFLLTKQEARPAVTEGPLLPGDTGAAKPQGFLKTATQKQIDTNTDNARQADAITRQRESDAERARHDQATERISANKPAATVTIQTVDANGNAVTRIVPKTAGSEFVKPANATTANRVANAETVNEVGNDIVRKLSDPNFRATVGPAMGRYGTLRDFIGDPPPEFSELAGQIESYALANMGVHGMRSAQGAEQIKRLLDQRHTPESLAATIKGLSDFSSRFAAHNKPKAGGAPAAPKDNDPLGIR